MATGMMASPAAGVIIQKLFHFVVLGLASSMIMFVALCLASSSDDNSRNLPFAEY